MYTQSTLATLLQSKNLKKGQVTIDSKSMIDLFVRHCEQNFHDPSFRAEVGKEVINVNDNESENVAFGRFSIVCNRGEIADGEMAEVGILAALDVAKPFLRLFAGTRVHACMNLSIFNAASITEIQLMNCVSIENAIGDGIKNVCKSSNDNDYQATEELKQFSVDYRQICEFIGKTSIEMDRLAKVSEHISMGARLMAKGAKYDATHGSTLWNVYNALTQVTSDKNNLLVEPLSNLTLYNMIKSHPWQSIVLSK